MKKVNGYPYPKQHFLIEVLLHAAKEAALETSAEHPVDIVSAMSVALDGAAETLAYLHEVDALGTIAYEEQAGREEGKS